MLDVREEKKLINNLLQKLINNRREINRHYDELIERLDVLIISEQSSTNTISEIKRSVSIMEREKIRNQDYLFSKNKTHHHVPFDRTSKNILAILKQSPVPLSNQQLLKKLNTEYELFISYKNLTCNILPKMLKERSLPIERAYRGYWQYCLPKL